MIVPQVQKGTKRYLLDNGGGKIKQKSMLAVVLLLALTLLINVSDVSAANSTFNTTSVGKSADTVKNYVETNHKVPDNVTVANKNVSSAQYLYLLTSTVQNINDGKTTPVTLKSVTKPSQPSETVISGTLTKSEYASIAKRLTTFINTYGRLPSYVSTSLGNMRYENLIYTYSKIMAFYKTNNRLPNTVSVKPWTTISVTPPEGYNGILRPVYIVSDNINNLATDTARINSLISALAKLGISAYNFGIGPQTHLSVLSNTNVPKNALIVEIAGGADAGAIYEKGTAWYKNLLGARKDFIAFTNGATKITGLAWLPRAHDDNYDPPSFTGLAHPDQFLLNNGYNYFEGLTSTNIGQLAQSIFNVASS